MKRTFQHQTSEDHKGHHDHDRHGYDDDDDDEESPHTPRLPITHEQLSTYIRSLSAAAAYAIVSTSMAFLNKALLDSYSFNFPFTILTAQMVLTETILLILHQVKVISLPKPEWDKLRMFFLPCLFSAANSSLSLSALESMNLTMYSVLKRCGPMTTMVLTCLLLRKSWPNRKVVLSVVMMTIGCIIAAEGDLTFHAYTYAVGATAVLAQAIYLILLQRLSTKFTTIETLQNTSLIGFPLLSAAAVLSGELNLVRHYSEHHHLGVDFFILLLSVLTAGCLLSYTLFLCNSLNSALTTSIVGTVKSVFQTTIGLFAFGGIKINIFIIIGVTTNLSGGILYTFAKYLDSLNPKPPTANESENTKITVDGHAHKPHENDGVVVVVKKDGSVSNEV